jgi:hypothetical protein
LLGAERRLGATARLELLRGRMLLLEGDAPMAREVLRRVVANPGDGKIAALSWCALAELAEGDTKTAEARVDLALREEPNDPLATRVLALILEQRGEKVAGAFRERATRLTEEALKMRRLQVCKKCPQRLRVPPPATTTGDGWNALVPRPRLHSLSRPRCLSVPRASRRGRLRAEDAPSRRDPRRLLDSGRHHHGRAGARPRRDRAHGHVPDRERDERHPPQRGNSQCFALRSVCRDHRLRRRDRRLVRPADGAGAPAHRPGRAPALGGDTRARAGLDGPGDDLPVRREVRAALGHAAAHAPRLGNRAEIEERQRRRGGQHDGRRAQAVPGARRQGPARSRRALADRRHRRAPGREHQRRRRLRRATRRELHDPRTGHAARRGSSSATSPTSTWARRSATASSPTTASGRPSRASS